MNAFDAVFWLLALLSVGSALAVVLARNVFRAALLLILCFFTVAGLFITLQADFLAGVQVLIYVGAISILLIMALMLTHDYWHGNQPGKLKTPALVVTVMLLGVIIYSVLGTSWQISNQVSTTPTTAAIGQRLFGEGGFLLPVEIAALMLLSAILGAIVLLREK